MKNSTVYIVLAISVLAVVLVGFISSTPTDVQAINIGGAEMSVLVADDALEQKKGFSGYQLEDLKEDGMLFIFKEKKERVFWMNGMKFDLDVVWIKDNKVVKIDRNIPAPHGDDPERMRSLPYSVDMVLELPAGTADRYGLLPGHPVRILD